MEDIERVVSEEQEMKTSDTLLLSQRQCPATRRVQQNSEVGEEN